MPLLNTEGKYIVLASQSPRRIELLKKIISDFDIKASDINEQDNGFTSPSQLVEELARRKAEKAAQEVTDGLIIAADSVVVCEGQILGKPQHADDSRRMLKLLSGKTHQVYSGFAVIRKPQGPTILEHEMTRVTFRQLEDWEIERYIASGQPQDKAGAYGIQDDAAVFVESLVGCYYNVMGLPLTKLFLVLKEFLT
ncbi:MAG: Maf family protein [candidate division KSB1 bacterium]|nr:Maf family protein [candidate division KSB1 bacterium]MDZ7317874.1 Maf family protein [candidate division KSB1 bacterium]MDZ7341403.1 Maf family protein [candidate division KSB1 bacterium]